MNELLTKENELEQKRERNYGLDLLKVLAIAMVVLLHYNYGAMGGLLNIQDQTLTNYHIAHTTECAAIIACNLFVIISGYYLCKSNQIKVRKIVDIIFLLVFYGVAIYIIAVFKGWTVVNSISIKTLLLTIDSRWFIDIYILLYILHPFCNKLIKNLSQKNFKRLIYICIFFFSIWTSIIVPENIINTMQFVQDGGYGIINFIMLYFIGAYIRLYKDNMKVNKLLIFLLYIILVFIDEKISTKYAQPFSYNFIINIVNTIIMFLIFKDLNIKKGRNLITTISSTTLAIYIIHENGYISKRIFVEIFKTPQFYYSNLLIPHMLGTVFAITTVCAIIELIRKRIFKKTVDKLLDKSKHLNKIIEIE